MTLAAAALTIALFGLLLSVLRVVPTTRRITAKARDALSLMRDTDVDDDTKERRIQQASLALFGLFLSITLRSVVAFAAPALLILSLDYIGLVRAGDVYRLLLSWPVVVAAVLFMSAVCWRQWR